jgi:small-conductance mechanosensitive channel
MLAGQIGGEMTKLLWMLFQAAIFFGVSYYAYIDMVAKNPTARENAPASLVVGLVVTVLITAAIMHTQNWLARRRQKRLSRTAGSEQSAHQSITGRAGAGTSRKITDGVHTLRPRK